VPLAVRDVLVSTAEGFLPEQHLHQLQNVIHAQYDQAAMAIQHHMHRSVIQRLHQIDRRSNKPSLVPGDLVMEIAPAAGP
jgi:hypothetical protein